MSGWRNTNQTKKTNNNNKNIFIMNFENKLTEMTNMLKDAITDGIKFDKGNNAAGTRIRKVMQDLKAMAQEVRIAVQEQKNNA